MLVDCFPYFNEREILELRINVLKDHVDGFIVTEGNLTHRGEPKEFTCVNTIRELGLPEDMIQVMHVELPPYETHPDPWIRERGQRDALSVALDLLPEETHFICSDCDEITNPRIIPELIQCIDEHPDEIVRLSMSMHYGRADRQLQSPEGEKFDWRCGVASTVKQLKDAQTLSNMRMSENNRYFGNRDAGWHFSWMGDSDARKLKLRSIAEYYIWDKPEVQQLCDSFEAEEGNTDMLGRLDHIITSYPVDKLPPEVSTIERVRKFLLPDGK